MIALQLLVVFIFYGTSLRADTADFANAGLTEFPTSIPEGAILLDLQYNTISSVPADAFLNLTAMVTVQFKHNELTEMPNFIPIAATLEHLDLAGNDIITLSQDILNELVNLQTFSALSNKIRVLPDLSPLVMLTSLKLSKNRLTEIEATDFIGLPHLDYLQLNNNPLTVVDNQLQLPSNLRNLRLGKNNLGLISYSCEAGLNGCNLNELHNHEADIETVPLLADFKDHLSILYLTTNRLTDEGVSDLHTFTALSILDCSHNLLTQIPDLSGSTGTFTKLFLSNNSIATVLPAHVMGMNNLRKLDLSMNAITTLPEFPISLLTSLTELNIGQQDINCNCEMVWMKSTNTIIPVAPCVTPVSMLNVVLDDIPEEDFICNGEWIIQAGS